MTDDERLQQLIDSAEAAYDRLYEAHGDIEATSCYSEAKENLYDAIQLARKLGLTEKVRGLHARLDHIKAVFRSQFS